MQDVAAPVRGGDTVLGVLALRRHSAVGLPEEELSLVSAVAGQVAAALLNIESATRTGRLARQMATLYELGLETSATRDLARLYARAAEEAGRLIDADHASVLRLHPERGRLELFASWARHRSQEPPPVPMFEMGEGVAGRVARDRVPALVNDPAQEPGFVARYAPVGRLLCVPVAYHDRDADAPVVFGVLNATRDPGGAPFTPDDLEYLNRFATQLAIAAANSVALLGERARSDQLALVNRVLREVAGSLSRERVLETATRAIQEAFCFPTVLLVVPDADAGVNRIAAAWGHTLPPRGLESYPIEAGVAARVIRDRRSVVLNDVAEAADYLATVPSTRSETMVPVLAADEVVALLDVQSDTVGAFDRGMVLTLETLADGIAIALRNADLYQALERTNAQLLELDRMKSELVHIVAHDFRAPLAGVMGNAELLEWKPDAPREERIGQAREILRASEHMSSMVQKTLQTTRLESGQFGFQFGLVDLAATVRTVAARLAEDPQRPVALELPEDPVPCWADGERICEVLENLLSNARRFAPDGGDVVVALAREGDSALLSVTDHGIGIEPRHHARLFRPFSRVREGRAAEVEGSGLGLYLCERIVRAHGGMLSLASELGRGSTFTFSLPLFGLAEQTRPPLLLVATRDESTRRAVRGLAAELGYGVHEVADGVGAVEAAARLLPAGVLADRVLPRLGAPEIAQRLRDSPSTRAIPVVALASASEVGEGASLMHACLPRPVERAALAEALATLAARF
jgi:signal transduction histidine kinase